MEEEKEEPFIARLECPACKKIFDFEVKPLCRINKFCADCMKIRRKETYHRWYQRNRERHIAYVISAKKKKTEQAKQQKQQTQIQTEIQPQNETQKTNGCLQTPTLETEPKEQMQTEEREIKYGG